MIPYFEDAWMRIYHGDTLKVLRTLPNESVNCVVTSPPYWGLRDYGIDGQLGLERTPEEYIAKMVAVFREVRRVLRDDGVLWINIGDCYATGAGKVGECPGGGDQGERWKGFRGDRPFDAKRNPAAVPMGPRTQPNRMPIDGLKPKDLVGVPWMLAFALRSDGWWLRGDHVWGKPNGMPESVEDRPTRGHEYVFLLSKSERYFYNAEAVRTAPKASTETRLKQDVESQAASLRANGETRTDRPMKAVRRSDKQRGHSRRHDGFNDRWDHMKREEQMQDGANLRSVWWISPAQFEEAHFAVMPEKLARICILAGCPEGGTVLDPFGGSMTTLKVAQDLNCKGIGIDLNLEYISIALRARMPQVGLQFPVSTNSV